MKILCVVGPTGTGKSSIAACLAQNFQGEIINCDSRQVYQDFPCITAQPDATALEKCSHWLYGFLATHDKIDAGRYASMADTRISQVQARGNLPVLVGGTGLYLNTLIHGLAPMPDVPDSIRDEVAKKCAAFGPYFLYLWLQAVDPEAASKIHFNDKQRITRALEVYLASGKKISWWWQQGQRGDKRYIPLKIGIWQDIDGLDKILSARIERMIKNGACREIEQAWAKCPDESAPGWSAIGAYELLQYYLGRCSLQEAKGDWLKRTRDYAKRQMTWFKKEEDIHWFAPEEQDKIAEFIQTSFIGQNKDSVVERDDV